MIMKPLTINSLKFFIFLSSALLVNFSFSQNNYPNKPIRIISPYSAGGTTDILARLIAPKLIESWGQQIIVDNRPGGNTVIGSEATVKSSADGYTLLSILTSHVIVPNLMQTPYDAIKDFSAIATLAKTQLVMVVHPSLPAKNLQQLINLAKNKPMQLNYSSGGSGTVTHLAGEFFNMLANVKTNHIPYKGSAQALIDVVGGQVQMYYSPPIVAISHMKNNRLRGIVTTGDNRLSVLPDIPTAVESGMKQFIMNIWYGFLAPANVPVYIINKLNLEISRILSIPDIREKLLSQGMEPYVTSPDQFSSLMKINLAKYNKIINNANIKLEQ